MVVGGGGVAWEAGALIGMQAAVTFGIGMQVSVTFGIGMGGRSLDSHQYIRAVSDGELG